MLRKNWSVNGANNQLCFGLTMLGMLTAASPGFALQVYDGSNYGNNLEINLNILTTYTLTQRVGQPSAILVQSANNPNGNDGDANLQHGIVNNLFEVLPVLDIKDNRFGMHFSGEYFINTVYLGTTSNNQPSSINPILPKSNDFASQTRTANGMNGRLLDAFVYNSWGFGKGQDITLKAGQQTLFWGQSLFSTDGISGGQAPIDLVQAQNLVNPQSQQVFLPVGQIVATYQPNQTFTLQGYYQYQWEPYAFQGVGSFFSTSDVLGPAGYRIVAVQSSSGNLYLSRTKDLSPPSQNGQFGVSVQGQFGNYDGGLFALRYDSKTPLAYSNITGISGSTPGGKLLGTYTLVYPRDIWLYGTSLSTTVGATNIAGELSVRSHDPLDGSETGSGSQSAANMGNANNDPLYPVGNVMVGLVNAIYGSPALRLDPGGVTLLGEFEWDNVIRVTDNKALLAPGRSSQAASMDVEAIPAYFEVLPHTELEFPVSVNYNLFGNSQAAEAMTHGTGTYSLSIDATYRNTWDASLSYVGFFGRASANPSLPNVSVLTVDRSYVSLTLQHSF